MSLLPLQGLPWHWERNKYAAKVPSGQSVADRLVADLTGKPGNGRLKLGKARMQALY